MANIKSIWDNQKPTGDIIIKTRLDDITHLNCFAATNNITGQLLFIVAVSKGVIIPDLKNYRFKGVEVYLLQNDNGNELYIYLLDDSLRDIFSLFIQNILEDITDIQNENEAIITILNVISKWKKLFDKINFNGLNIEQQKGLIGELLFFNYLLNNQKNSGNILKAWTGSDFEDKDYVFGSIGVEIKMTSSKYPKIKITNERQLDLESLNSLFLVLYITEEVKENGFSLNSLISQIRQKIEIYPENLKYFNDTLIKLGYIDEDKDNYNRLYSLKQDLLFTVTDDFPKITPNQIPMGVYNTSYSIELSAAEKFIVNLDKILTSI